MPTSPAPDDPERFEPRAVGALAGMFDDVSGRYDLLNRIMSLGQDGAWRAAMWRAVPPGARVCLDLCTGSGASLQGLLRPGRLVLGMDASLGMLELAAETFEGPGWAPRLACADAFRLPLRDHSLDTITIAFGIRNLRPRAQALAELARVLAPGGVLSVLEAVSPRPGPFAPFHRFYLEHVVPLVGRLSGDPSAYRYLSQSIFEFGDGDSFERDLAAAGFEVGLRRRFLLGATGLWAARRVPAGGEISAVSPSALHDARPGGGGRGHFAPPESGAEAEWRAWTWAQLLFALALVAALVWALVVYLKSGTALPLEPLPRRGLGILLGLGLLFFLGRSVILGLRLQARAPGR
jgi:demethylmenaquinone methyltransferase/2-methoxy-6-polyprenyl-1,4-benzoquinol methylase